MILGQCRLCSEQSSLVSSQLGVCLKCIRNKPEKAINIADNVHAESREIFGLPTKPPVESDGISCGICSNDCRIGEGGKGFCGLVLNREGRLVRMGGTVERGVLQWYYDPLPTNCVSWWFCPGCTGAGYPEYANSRGAETGYANLAVFYGACSLDCLFCQNWHYRNLVAKLDPIMSAEGLAARVDCHVSGVHYHIDEKRQTREVSCICFFGGDPSSQMPHALKTSKLTLEMARKQKRILRICWETNGYWKEEFALKAAELSLTSGGNIKFDLKTWDDNLNKVLCGVSNKPILESFKMIGEGFFRKRYEVPVLSASTLLIPGYVDVKEIRNLARFIAEVDSAIPYTLLAFYPHYVMNDLPTTRREQANQCYHAATEHLENVRIGNIHLLS